MSEQVDCRGLSCPEPVLMTRQALLQATGNAFEVMVSNAVARDNVKRAASGMGWKVDVKPDGDGFKLNITR